MGRQVFVKKMVMQKLVGLVLLIVCGVIFWMASKGESVVDRDITPVILIAPLGLGMLFSKKLLIL